MDDLCYFQTSSGVLSQLDLNQSNANTHEELDTAESWIEHLPQGIRDKIALHVTRYVWNADIQHLTAVSPRWYRSVWDTVSEQVDLKLPFWVLEKGKHWNAREAQIEVERNKMVESSDGRPDYYDFHCWRELNKYIGLKIPEGMEDEYDEHLRITDLLNALIQLKLSDEKTLYLEFYCGYVRKLAIKFRRLSVEFIGMEEIRVDSVFASVRKNFGTPPFETLWVAGAIEVPDTINQVADICANHVRSSVSPDCSVKWTARPVRMRLRDVSIEALMTGYKKAISNLPHRAFVEVYFPVLFEQVRQKLRSFRSLSLICHQSSHATAFDIGEPLVKLVIHFYSCGSPLFGTSNFLDLHKLRNCSRLKELRFAACSHVLPTLAAVLKRLPLLRNLTIALMSTKCMAGLRIWSNVINSTHHSLKLDVTICFHSLTQCRELLKCFGHRLNRINGHNVVQRNGNVSFTETMDYLEVCLSSIALYNPNICCFQAEFIPYDPPLDRYPQRARRIELLAKKLKNLRPRLNFCRRIQRWIIKIEGLYRTLLVTRGRVGTNRYAGERGGGYRS